MLSTSHKPERSRCVRTKAREQRIVITLRETIGNLYIAVFSRFHICFTMQSYQSFHGDPALHLKLDGGGKHLSRQDGKDIPADLMTMAGITEDLRNIGTGSIYTGGRKPLTRVSDGYPCFGLPTPSACCSCGDLRFSQHQCCTSMFSFARTEMEVVVLSVADEDQTANDVDESCAFRQPNVRSMCIQEPYASPRDSCPCILPGIFAGIPLA